MLSRHHLPAISGRAGFAKSAQGGADRNALRYISLYDIYGSPDEWIAMRTLFEIVEPILLIFGSIAGAIALCWLLWRWFKLLHHPDWAAYAAVAAGALALYATSPNHVFYRMIVAFTLVGAVPLWIEGRAWCQQQARPVVAPEPHRSRDLAHAPADPSRRYPIMIACIGEARQPRQEEVRAVAARIWREGLRQQATPQSPAGSFAMRRFVFRVAQAALSGHANRPVARKHPDNDL